MVPRLSVLVLAILLATTIPPARTTYAQSSPCAVAAAAALSARGAPYVWGAKGPAAFDCSGLVYWAWTQAGYDVGISTYDQARAGVQIVCSLADLAGTATTCWQAGDLILLRYAGGQHVAMYIGNGLFADAYNRDTGVIVHNPATDQFYWDHYWQSRRITNCDGATVDPGAASTTILASPGMEQLPDLLGPVSFSIPQCGECNADGSVILPPTVWDGHWPTNLLELGSVFQSAISWLAWRIYEMIRMLICWLLSMFAVLAAILSAIANLIVSGINGLWKIGLLLILAFQAWMTAIFYLLDDIARAIPSLLAIIGNIYDLITIAVTVVVTVIGMILSVLGLIVGRIIGFLGWTGGLLIGILIVIVQALNGTSIPAQLNTTSNVYYAVRGMLEGMRDSPFGWVLALFWAMAYIGFVFWATRFLSGFSSATE